MGIIKGVLIILLAFGPVAVFAGLWEICVRVFGDVGND